MSKTSTHEPFSEQGPEQVPLKHKLNLETSRIAWRELQVFFAQGKVIEVAKQLDLLTVAEQMAADNAAMVAAWMQDGLVRTVPDKQAAAWFEGDADVWAVVIRPWVLVQAGKHEDS